MNIRNIIVAVCSLLFLMVGADKFLSFMEPPCSMESNISPILWQVFGVLQIAGGILIWSPKYRRYVTGFFFAFMLVFTIYHLLENTYDVGGSVFMALLLGLLFWNPSFLSRGLKQNS